mmetsp:Transcript_40480/g.86370  ORF Transcript_40480/g.86370 Transcript_40480/m.86370 type:complete len:129 (-) Transcript_40480:257-643(-)|eukprot:CAMPEP_0183331710 /NCGR_PEP_ID=MMETSP0164_2-20130417/1032_1 /TAXON_ID=221442 /ORGANISM="Coccolithus pelagicus ssp braarudi, Strain PLY182g" /LENGTH=128 /DNA_ID=CAMNT_0025500261 /DNA_START=46 /DNA_END=432 /DNA_ORIENTATION=-
MRAFLAFCLLASVSAFQLAAPSHASTVRRTSVSPVMVADTSIVDATSSLVAAAAVAGPLFSAPKAGVMMVANILTIFYTEIDGKSLSSGTKHDEMVESFGITWLLAGASLGHIVGAGAILGLGALGKV